MRGHAVRGGAWPTVCEASRGGTASTSRPRTILIFYCTTAAAHQGRDADEEVNAPPGEGRDHLRESKKDERKVRVCAMRRVCARVRRVYDGLWVPSADALVPSALNSALHSVACLGARRRGAGRERAGRQSGNRERERAGREGERARSGLNSRGIARAGEERCPTPPQGSVHALPPAAGQWSVQYRFWETPRTHQTGARDARA